MKFLITRAIFQVLNSPTWLVAQAVTLPGVIIIPNGGKCLGGQLWRHEAVVPPSPTCGMTSASNCDVLEPLRPSTEKDITSGSK